MGLTGELLAIVKLSGKRYRDPDSKSLSGALIVFRYQGSARYRGLLPIGENGRVFSLGLQLLSGTRAL